MKSHRSIVFLIFFLASFLLTASTNAQQIAYTPEGEKVFLNEDGTWKVEVALEEEEKEEILVMKKYLAAIKWEDRLEQVTEPQKVKHLMAERYKDFQGPYDYVSVSLLDEDGSELAREKWTKS